MGELSNDPFLAARLILTLRRAGITDADVLRAIEAVPRRAFVEVDVADLAYEDCVLPIGCGQTLEPPSVVASMLQALNLKTPNEAKVLVIGAGSGYTLALLNLLADEVMAMERFRRLKDRALHNLATIGIDSIEVRHADGLAGWPDRGPFDRILLTGEVTEVPAALLSQLTERGTCIAPISNPANQTILTVLNAEGREVAARPTVHHTPLRHGVSKVL